MVDGWFKLPGRTGARTLAEQLTGLERALVDARGRTVLDLGCAEGLIAMEFARAGASAVVGIDSNDDLLKQGRLILDRARMREPRLRVVELQHADLNDAEECTSYDVVLALAIFHKLRDPVGALHSWADMADELLVVRHQSGSRGVIRAKQYPHPEADSRAILPGLGFELELEAGGPRDEIVHYWRRVVRC